MTRQLIAAFSSFLLLGATLQAAPPEPARTPLVRAVDLNVGQSEQVELCDGTTATVELVELLETRDALRAAVRRARVVVEVNGERVTLTSGNYHLPVSVAGVQVDCPITKGYNANTTSDHWSLEKDARLRLWPAGSPWVAPGTFQYPAVQRWFASGTQMANEPTFVDGGEAASNKRIYYHSGLDLGGAEGMIDIVAATDGLVVSARDETLPGYDDSPVEPRYDVIYLLDERGWYYRYSHLQSIDAAVQPGVRVARGQKIGVLGKEGGSGGWSHLHFEIKARQPSGKWGTEEGYAFLWEAYRRQYDPALIAVARPHHFAWAGEEVVLDASRSRSRSGKIASYQWTLTDGITATGPKITRTYRRPGEYSEILKVTDDAGNVDYDFAVVLILSSDHPEQLPPTVHPAYAPTFGIKPGDPVTFKVRAFRTTDGEETWDFGDGSSAVQVKSDGNVEMHAKDGYAITTHRYAEPGDYLVRVSRTDRHGHTGIGHLHVHVGDE